MDLVRKRQMVDPHAVVLQAARERLAFFAQRIETGGDDERVGRATQIQRGKRESALGRNGRRTHVLRAEPPHGQ